MRASAARSVSIASAAKARAAPSASRRACACGDSPARAGPCDEDTDPIDPDEGLEPRVARGIGGLRGRGHRDGRPDPRVARRLGAGPAWRGEEHPRLALPPLDERARFDHRRVPCDGRAIDLGPDCIGGHGGPRGDVARCGNSDDERHGGLRVGGARATARERPPRSPLGRVARVCRALGELAAEAHRGGSVRDLHRELLPRERGRRGDPGRRVGREVARGEVDRRGEAASVDVSGRDDRAHARRGLERREPRDEWPSRIPEGRRHRHGTLRRRRPCGDDDAGSSWPRSRPRLRTRPWGLVPARATAEPVLPRARPARARASARRRRRWRRSRRSRTRRARDRAPRDAMSRAPPPGASRHRPRRTPRRCTSPCRRAPGRARAGARERPPCAQPPQGPPRRGPRGSAARCGLRRRPGRRPPENRRARAVAIRPSRRWRSRSPRGPRVDSRRAPPARRPRELRDRVRLRRS